MTDFMFKNDKFTKACRGHVLHKNSLDKKSVDN